MIVKPCPETGYWWINLTGLPPVLVGIKNRKSAVNHYLNFTLPRVLRDEECIH